MIRDVRNVAFAVGWRVIHNVVKNPTLFLIPSTLFPLIQFAAFAGGLSQLRHIAGFDYPPGYVGFQFCFVLLQSAAFTGVFTGFGIARDFEYGFSRRLFVAAPRRSGIVIGYAIGAFLRWTIVGAVITVVALAAGMHVKADGVDVVGMYALAIVVNFAFALWACGMAMRFQTIQAGPIMQTPVFLLLFFAPVYVPLKLLQGWMHGVASTNPVTHVLEAIRSLLAGEPTGIGIAYGIAFALVVAFAAWALWNLRYAESTT